MSTPSFYYLCGRGYNALARAAAAPTAGSADSVHGSLAPLYDYDTDDLFMFAGTAGLSYVDLISDRVVNGGFETAFSGGVPGAGWGTGAGATVTREAFAAPGEGSWCMRVAGANKCDYFDVEVAAGEVLNVAVHITTDLVGGAGSGRVKCQNRTTGKWLTTGFVWEATEKAFAVGSDETAWTYTRGTFTVEPYSTTLSDMVTLRFYFYNMDPAAWSEFDGFRLWPRVDCCAIIAHNIPAGSTARLYSSTPGPNTLKATLTTAQPTMWSTFTAIDDYAFRLAISDPPDLRQVWMRELILGQARTLTQQREDGDEALLLDTQDRSDSDIGSVAAYVRMDRGRRKLSLKLKHPSSTELGEWREIMERSRNGAYPLLMIPDSTQANAAMLCRVSPEWASSHMRGSFWSGGVELDELPFPALVS